jgi:hypothetical protein
MELKSIDFDWSLRRVMKDNSTLSLSLVQFERLTFGHLPWETPGGFTRPQGLFAV